MGASLEAPTASSSDAERPLQFWFRNRLDHHTPSPQGDYQALRKNKILKHKAHVAIFVYGRALSNSLWRKWMATILLLQIKTKGR